MTGPDRESSRQRNAQEADWRSSEGERLLVCGIGASAGGLEAFERFLQKLPDDSGLAYLFAQHLDPQHKSLLADLLGRAAPIPVEFAKDCQPIERDHVYVMPQNAGLLVEGGKLRVVAGESRSSRLPINAFLTSLAEDQRENAVGIVLSGSGSDGALGIAAVKQHGGRTFAQLPADARYESMPQAAIASGAVDEVLPAEQIPAALARLVAERRQHPGESPRGESEGLREAFEILGRKTGHDFSRYKRTTVLRRFHRRMAATGMATVRDYAALLDREEGEVHRLRDDLMINVTSFFRDGEPPQTLERVVIPDIMERRADGGVRAWVPGCSSGEEAYSIAMLFRERMEQMARPPEVKIFATDIDASALAEGRRGRYTSAVERQVSPERLAHFFTKDDGTYTIAKDVRDLCIFTEHDLLKDPPFSHMDLVSCRNLLIYLEPPLQQRVLELLHYALRPGGYLILGKAETIGTPGLFEVVEKSDRLYRRREVERNPVRGIPPLPGPGGGRASPLDMAPLARRSGAAVQSAADRSRNMVLEEYAPPSVVVDGHGEIRYFWGADLASYLPPQAGPLATNLLHLVRGELRVELSAALHSAARQAKPVQYKDRAVVVQGEERRINLIVRPLPPTERDPDDLFLVVFQQLHPGPAAQGAPLDAPTLERYRQLELDLENTRGRLQLTVDELENANEALRASNEELQSMNEELHSSNEELQTSQEELQSVNEELNTANAELSKKVEELEILYGDLQNLFQSTQIATVFLDRQLRIARFTPQAKELFRLADGDVGRPISDFTARFDAEGLSEEVERVMRTLEPADRSIRTLHDGRWFVMRIHPYRTLSNVIAGVVISFLDVVKLKAAESALQEVVAERDATAQALLDADRRKDEFLAILSHELRNPLAPISSSLHILDRAPAGSDAARRAQQIIARQVAHLTRLVNDLLEVTRVTRGKLQVERQRIDLSEVVRRTSDDHRAVMAQHHLALEVVLPERPVWVEGDSTRLAQVLGNLLQNAAKFTPDEGSVRVFLDAVDGSAELRVRDTGIGIDPVLLHRLFQPFAQAENTLDRTRGGLGLGLALVKGLVGLHEGTVEAHSAGTGAGTEFVVRLPLSAPPEAIAEAERVPAGPRRILVIEDNPDAAESLRMELGLQGHEVETALDGPQGIAKARELAPDVVLCDIGLPGMDGYQVAKALREAPGPRRSYLIALTGYARPQDQERAKAAGFDAHIAKPPTHEQLQEAIARAPGCASAPG
ncbi:MAG TPA: chemotaxis protein CheB [Anaeromyxobacteraceae bacterium]|nr:chemotaxis protein CheB [Anaeromyxobacteraceae bacterium]